MPALSPRGQGYIFAVAAPLCWSVGGVVMRSVDTGPWEIVFWRAIAHVVCMPLILVFFLRVPMMRDLRAAGGIFSLSALMVAATLVLHVIGMTSTTVANALLLQSVSPLIVALLARFVLGEAVALASWFAIAVAFAGLGLVVGAALDEGALAGKLAAVTVAVASAINVTLVRRTRASLDLRPAQIPAAILASAISFAFGHPFSTPTGDALLLMGLGFVQMTIGVNFFYSALRRLSPVEVTLIALLEPILGPLWTWLFIGEVPATGTLVGGGVLLGALVFNTLVTARARAAT
ncbi:MAG: EamA family transporter [Alphaproteobacteria bacterium]|nr:EamA family transporter [Alphaproteobacteria bacterium]